MLVTGAGGFIASHLTEELARRGARVRALVHYNSRSHWGFLERLDPELSRRVELRPGDVTDPSCVLDLVKGQDAVFHLAALIAIPYSSTSEVYGTALYAPIDEAHPLQGQSPYSASKIGADHLAESFFRSFGLPVAIARPFNTYGPRQSARAVIPTIICQLLRQPPELKLGSLKPVRDFNFVADTVEGFLAVAASPKSVGQAINLGSGRGVSVAETAALIARLLGLRARIKADKARLRPADSEVYRLICDNRKARRLLGWRPRYSLEEGLALTIDYIRRHRADYKAGVYNV